MGLVTEARRVLETLPPGVREAVGSWGAWAPRPWLYGARFRKVQASLAATERRPAHELFAWQDARVRELVAYAYERVPYYRRVMDERGVRPDHVRGASDLHLLPLLTKQELRCQADSLLALGRSRASREIVSTGGTSGEPIRFWIDRGRSSTEWAFMTWQWRSAGYRLGSRRAVLRGTPVRESGSQRLHHWHPLLDELALSTFDLTAETLPRYLDLIARYRPEFLHAYPSSAEHFARLLEDVPPSRRPRFRALLLGSENLYPAQRSALERAFGCRVLSWYGHSEKCLLGAGCEFSEEYHLFPQYGVLEVVDDEGKPVGEGETGFIVGTGFLNRAMPFLRYATDDRATLAVGGCRCGRAYPRLASIEGRWEGERLYGDRGREFSMTALNTHHDIFRRVLRFRIRQDRVGEATVLVVPGRGFDDGDARAIAEEYAGRTGGSIRFRVESVAELDLTARGKFKFVDQRLEEAGTPARAAGAGE